MNSKNQIILFVVIFSALICGIGTTTYYLYKKTTEPTSAPTAFEHISDNTVSDNEMQYTDLMGDDPLEKQIIYWLDAHKFTKRYKYYMDDLIYIKGTNIILQPYEGELYPGDTCFNYVDYNGFQVSFSKIYDAVQYLYYVKEYLYESYQIKEYDDDHITLTNLNTEEDITITWSEIDDVSESFEY